MHRTAFRIAAASLALVPTVAFAHPGHEGPGLVAGFLHPLGGVDHIIAMMAVGLLAARLGGRALWLVPASFVATMTVAGLAGVAGLGLPYVETGIALSVVVLAGRGRVRSRHWCLSDWRSRRWMRCLSPLSARRSSFFSASPSCASSRTGSAISSAGPALCWRRRCGQCWRSRGSLAQAAYWS